MRWGWALAVGGALAILLVLVATRRSGPRVGGEARGIEARVAQAVEPVSVPRPADPGRAELEREPTESVAVPPRSAESSPTLLVRVLDPLGVPLEGFDVAVASAPIEPEELAFSERRLATDAAGRARFDEMPQEVRLTVALRGQDLYERFVRMRAGELVQGEAPGSEPLLVAAGETREVELRLGTRVRLRGIVLEEGVGPVPDVVVYAVAHPPEGSAGGSVRSREDGSFELELLSHVPLVAVDVLAERRPIGGMFQAKPPTHRASSRVSLAEQSTGEASVTLVLAPTLAIAGRVVEADGRTAEGRLRARRREDGVGPRLEQSTNVVDGEFRVSGLVEGEYELEMLADHRRGTSVLLGTFTAGTPNLELELPLAARARVTLEVSTAAGLGGLASVVVAHLVEPQGPIEATLAREATFDAPLGWPENSLGDLGSGVSNFRSSFGEMKHSIGTCETNPCVLELAAGPYCLGARGVDALGRPLFPAGTGLLRLEEGEHHLRLELVPATALVGQVEGTRAQEELHVALTLADGRLVPLDDGRGRMRATSPLDARGDFRFELVPTGTFELCVGSETELRADRARLRQAVTLRADEPCRLTLAL